MHLLRPSGPVTILKGPPPIPKRAEVHASKGVLATGKAERDAAQIRALCVASNNAPAGLPKSVCKGVQR